MKKLIYLTMISGVILSTSCNDWLDITPHGQTQAEELYKTSRGCNSALGGIYYTLSSSDLYGKNLSYGAIDILAHYWDISTSTNHVYYKLYSYDYKDQSSVAIFDAIWGNMYQAITQCNALLHYLPGSREDIENADLIEGEAYALRAFIHLELFEMYGAVIRTKADLQKKAIAYRTEFDVTSKDFNTGEEVLNFAEQDLQKALELLKDDPVKRTDIGRRGDANASLLDYHEVLNRRGSRLNYFCTLGLLARLEQLRLNPHEAYQYAQRVITEANGIIQLINKENNLPTNPSRNFAYSMEMLGAIYVNNLYDMTNEFFYMEGKGDSNLSIPIGDTQYSSLLNTIYGRTPDGAGTDNRLRYWFEKTENIYNFQKLHEAPVQSGLRAAYDPEIPVMRMSEIYYIACESKIGIDNTLALQYLNDVRKTRNLEELPLPIGDVEVTLKEYLVREARKDMIGDGRIFLMCKRMFYPIYVKAGEEIAPSDEIFVFPIPDDEYEYTNNEKG